MGGKDGMWYEEKFTSIYNVCLLSVYFVPGTWGGKTKDE